MNKRSIILFVVGVNLTYKKYVNTFFKKVVFNIIFFALITLEYIVTLNLSLPYLYLFRILKIFIGFTCLFPTIMKWGSPTFKWYWDQAEEVVRKRGL